MKTIAHISVHRQGLGAEVFERALEVYPAGLKNVKVFAITEDVEHPSMIAIRKLLDEAGMRPWRIEAMDRDREYMLDFRRSYEPADLESAPLIELTPTDVSRRMWQRTDDDQLWIDEPVPLDLASVSRLSWVLVSDRLRRMIEDEGLTGAAFLAVEKRYESVDFDLDDDEDVYWELGSTRFLPPVAPSMTLIKRHRSEPFDGNFETGCIPVDGHYVCPELHYRRADLDRVEPVDIAATFERFGPRPRERDRHLIVSQRFYQAFLKHGLRAGDQSWAPVRIDDD